MAYMDLLLRPQNKAAFERYGAIEKTTTISFYNQPIQASKSCCRRDTRQTTTSPDPFRTQPKSDLTTRKLATDCRRPAPGACDVTRPPRRLRDELTFP
ncbi:hypothetical protein EVAR_2276_1 [Eumeta japonica]|uniref:Uncharacterized protein n=1 Tax=Eumeta variegata TaxID=151549 RepID=A0A4C1SIL9_EUMVA|nr:hypothetical protein EVAR_2276_1 [Eumeta japonica]